LLASRLTGEVRADELMRRLFATDASEYQELPRAVVFPESEGDVRETIRFASSSGMALIPRGAGTSLAGQVVGDGIVVDCGRLNNIVSIDPARRRVVVQPGVVRNELNHALREHGMLFGPETSTANRAMIGGMVGNNSCGANSVVYGSTREHLIRCRGFLSDGTEAVFGPLTPDEFHAKCEGDTLEARIYAEIRRILGDLSNQEMIAKTFPKSTISRRNTGYALDQLLNCKVFDRESARPFNFCQLLAGSEGTLFFGVEYELACSPLPPPHSALLCAHFWTVLESLRAVAPALVQTPFAVELIDRHILEATKRHRDQLANRFFVEGDPGAILVVDIRRDSPAEVESSIAQIIDELKTAGLGYHFPVLRGDEQHRVWELRRAGQGLMTNVPGDAKPREVVEDTAVDVVDLPAYIAEFDAIMRERHGIECVYYAHAGSGELHTRPLFNLKTPEGLRMFRAVAEDVAALVKKYRGSLSGEHGDGRLRGEFIPFMVGEECYALMRRVKEAFDPDHRFNPGKIIDTPPMDSSLRHHPGQPQPEYQTVFDFSESQGLLRAAERCNGSGDCRKGVLAGGVMCPSYMATKREEDSTRARANMLRQILGGAADAREAFASDEVAEVLDLCLSCKACKRECPSSVDLAKLKAEYMQGYYDAKGTPRRARLAGGFAGLQRRVRYAPWAWNALFGTPPIRRLLNRIVGFHPDRSIPLVPRRTLAGWFRRRAPHPSAGRVGEVLFFNDEFTNYIDVDAGVAAIELLERLGYRVTIPAHGESGRAWLSKGLVREAQTRINANTDALHAQVSRDKPLIGVEPSAILTFRDEAIDLAAGERQVRARAMARHCLMLEEFLVREADAGRIGRESFTGKGRQVLFHGHCFQKALAGAEASVVALSLPRNYAVETIPSTCCGMAGSFGYEAEHYDLSMRIAELALLPAVRAAPEAAIIAAPGTSCRHQIHDGAARAGLHPAQVLRMALVES